jgi:hypothetical protein
LEHNDATDKDLPADPDATEIVPVDAEALLHMELDAALQAQKRPSRPRIPSPRPAAGRPPSIATVRAMRAAPRASTRMPVSSSRFPSAKTALPRPPIHSLPPTLPPPRLNVDEDSDAAATRVFDRNSARMSTRTSVSFPAGTFSAPRIPQPFHTEPAIPAAKRASIPPADDSARTPIQPVLAPTSRRDIRISAFESIAPMSMSAFPSAPPPAAAAASLSKSSLVAIVLTMIFTLATVAVMGVAILKPSAIDRAKVALTPKAKPKRLEPVAAKPADPPPPASIAVPPVLIDDVPADLGEKETALFLPDSAKGHRVFVDGKVLNETDTSASYVIAACGKHKVQVGSTGKEQSLDLPCHGVAHPE